MEHDPVSVALLENHGACQREGCIESSVVLFILPAAAVQLLLPRSHTANMSAGGAL